MFDEETENLRYLSSAHASDGVQRTTSVDEADLRTLDRIIKILDDRIALRNSNDSLLAKHPAGFTIKQQLVINQAIVADSRELTMLIQTAIDQANKEGY